MIESKMQESEDAAVSNKALAARAAWPVALVTMPFAQAVSPSMQLGLLKALAAEQGFPATTFHLNLDFATRIGLTEYGPLCEMPPQRLGEWLFSAAAFGDEAPDPDDRLLERISAKDWQHLEQNGLTRERLRALRHEEIPDYLDRLLSEIPWEQFRVVGFTCSFEQNAASFALARRLKERFPNLVTVFGGANFDGEMGPELVRSVACIDYAVVGEGDRAFPELLIALAEGRDPAQAPGVVCRRAGEVTLPAKRPLFDQLDELPVPDYSEFFARLDSLGFLSGAERSDLRIPFESARGCWWGAKHHCTFCGLNGNGMRFRSKSPERVLAELAELARRHQSFKFFAVDNILDLSYLKDFFSRLCEEGRDYEFFYEVKSNLTRAQIKNLYDGGVRIIQPGIESLNSHVLRLMRKGVTAIQNVNTLRWARYYGIQVAWNLLYGFPGETPEDYEQQAALLPHLVHLQPPGVAGRIMMERFSPLFNDRKAFPARYVRPEDSYQYIYPDRVNLERAVYFFDYELDDRLPEPVYAKSHELARAWHETWKTAPMRPRLTFRLSPGVIEIEDRRDPARTHTHRGGEPLASLYAACSDAPHTAAALRKQLNLNPPVEEIERALDKLCARGLMMRDGNQFLSLALPASRGR